MAALNRTGTGISVYFWRVAGTAVLILALLGGLIHHHESESDAAVCSYCHANVQTPVPNLARTLPAPRLIVVATLFLVPVSRWVHAFAVSSPIPRAPPIATPSTLFWKNCFSPA